MKVSELINLLKNLNQNATVVLSSDGEGNSFSPVYDIGIGRYYPYSSYGGDYYDCPEDYEELSDNFDDAIVLWPTN